MDTPQNQGAKMFDEVALLIETFGKNEPDYSEQDKLLDIFNVLESLLAYTAYTVSNSPETIRDCCEESYVNIKKKALKLYADNPQHTDE